MENHIISKCGIEYMFLRIIHCIIMAFMWTTFIGMSFSRKHYGFPSRQNKENTIFLKNWIVTFVSLLTATWKMFHFVSRVMGLEIWRELMNKHIRKATEHDRYAIALCIADGFEKDFSVLSKDNRKIASAIATGLQIDKFYVAETEGKIMATMAISDSYGRAARVDKPSMRKYLGFLKGLIASTVLKEEFEGQLDFPTGIGYIEFVTVRKEYRRKGIAMLLLKESMELSGYQEFILDVTDINTTAIQCYLQFGFKEIKRIPEKHAKQKGFHAKIYMFYSTKNQYIVPII